MYTRLVFREMAAGTAVLQTWMTTRSLILQKPGPIAPLSPEVPNASRFPVRALDAQTKRRMKTIRNAAVGKNQSRGCDPSVTSLIFFKTNMVTKYWWLKSCAGKEMYRDDLKW